MPRTSKKQLKTYAPASGGNDFGSERPDPMTAGQSGDTQGLSGIAQADSQSVEELVEEGQFFEAAIVEGVENAPPADAGEVTTREELEDDVPGEDLERESDVDRA